MSRRAPSGIFSPFGAEPPPVSFLRLEPPVLTPTPTPTSIQTPTQTDTHTHTQTLTPTPTLTLTPTLTRTQPFTPTPTPQVRFCDDADNKLWSGRQDALINCTWGFHRPPPLPESGGVGGLIGLGGRETLRCATNASVLLAARFAEPARSWSRGRNARWSTSDRPGYLYHQYMT